METEKSDTPLTDATDIATQLASQALLIELKCGKETGWIVQEAIKALRAAESAQAPVDGNYWHEVQAEAHSAARRIESISAQNEALKREADEDNDLIDLLSKLLAETSIALKGPELPLQRHSYHDVPKVAAEIALACRIGDELLRQEREKVAAAEQRADHLQAELDAAKVDAERYRWLRAHCQYGFEDHEGPQLIHRNGETGPHQNARWREDLDAAIDAARAKEEGNG